MNEIVIVSVAVVALGALYFFYKPAPSAAYSASQLQFAPPALPATQDPRQGNSLCQGAVGLAATGVATYYGGAAGGAAAAKTGASAAAGAGACAVAGRVASAADATDRYLDNKVGPGKYVVEAAVPPLAAYEGTKSVINEISSWF